MKRYLFPLTLFLTLFPALAPPAIPTVAAANNQNVELFLHRLPGNITVSGFSTREILNATSLWGGPNITPDLRFTAYNFSLYPPLALPLQSTGIGALDLWVTVSGAPGSLNATIYELNASGEEVVISSSVNVANSTDPNAPYRITIDLNLDREFSASSTLKLALVATGVGHLYLWYDSASNPSSLTLPTSNVPRISLIETFNSTLTPTTSFSLNWTTNQRIIYANIHVLDPFGAYHIKNASYTILDPSSQTFYSGVASPFSASPGSPEKLFGLSLAYDTTYALGNYTISSQAYDWSENQAIASSRFRIFSTVTPPTEPPTNPPTFPSWIFGPLALALALLILGLLLYRRSKEKCSKCGARLTRKMDKCPSCGQPTPWAAKQSPAPSLAAHTQAFQDNSTIPMLPPDEPADQG